MIGIVVPVIQVYIDNLFLDVPKSSLTEGLPITDTSSALACLVGYILMLAIGIPTMKNSDTGYELKTFKLFHNFFLFSLSLYMCVETIRQAYLGKYKLFGNDLELGNEPHAEGMARIVYIFYVSKAYEFVDTAVMIMCKKFNQVSFLHTYHHLTMFAIWHLIAVYAPGGDAYFSVILNSFVHVVMYAYYFCASLNLKWLNPVKPFITSLQMTQFMCMLIQSIYDYLYPCRYPQVLVKLLGMYMLTMLVLFGNFFIQTYIKQPVHKKNKLT